MLCFNSEAPGSPSITSTAADIQATSLTIRWTPPAEDGGSPITAYQVVLQQERNVTDPTNRGLEIVELRKNTHYAVMVSARNYVFKGNASHKNMKTTFEGKYLTVSRRSFTCCHKMLSWDNFMSCGLLGTLFLS